MNFNKFRNEYAYACKGGPKSKLLYFSLLSGMHTTLIMSLHYLVQYLQNGNMIE